jgi:hypothetical protein
MDAAQGMKPQSHKLIISLSCCKNTKKCEVTITRCAEASIAIRILFFRFVHDGRKKLYIVISMYPSNKT